jgi:hypothetical protein
MVIKVLKPMRSTSIFVCFLVCFFGTFKPAQQLIATRTNIIISNHSHITLFNTSLVVIHRYPFANIFHAFMLVRHHVLNLQNK